LRDLIASVPAFEIVGSHDFTHQLAVRRAFDDSQDDLVLILRKRTEG
jgi:hypothetical protein